MSSLARSTGNTILQQIQFYLIVRYFTVSGVLKLNAPMHTLFVAYIFFPFNNALVIMMIKCSAVTGIYYKTQVLLYA